MTGRMTRDPEVKTTQSGVSVCNFTIAVDRNHQKSGQPRVSDFVSVVAWRNDADFIVKYFHKGDMIAVVGELQSRKYTAKDGTEHTVWEVECTNVGFCGKRQANANGAEDLPKPPSINPSDTPADYEEIVGDDELPF
jgi:single-strand DNA-binding protein